MTELICAGCGEAYRNNPHDCASRRCPFCGSHEYEYAERPPEG